MGISGTRKEKQKVLDFAKSLIDGTSFYGCVNKEFLDLLVETSLAAAFFDKCRDRLSGGDHKSFKRIYQGVQALNAYHKNTINTLEASGVEYFFVKDWCEPLKNRYSCDVDVLIDQSNMGKAHDHLQKEGYLLHGVEIFHDKAFTKELFRLNVDQFRLLELLEKNTKLYQKYVVKKQEAKQQPERFCVDGHLRKLRSAEQEYLRRATVFPGSRYIYKQIDKRRRINKMKSVLILNSRVHLLFTINKLLGNKTFYIPYDTCFFSLLGKFEHSAAWEGSRDLGSIIKRHNLNYCRGPEFLDIKSQIPALSMAGKEDVLLDGNRLAPVDNLILNASHFAGNIKRKKRDHSYQGFLKYLLDGAVLIRRNTIDRQLLKQRARKFKKVSEVKYYLYLLNRTGLVSYSCALPSTFWFRVLKNIPRWRLLFNENCLYILSVKQAIRLINRWRVIQRRLQ